MGQHPKVVGAMVKWEPAPEGRATSPEPTIPWSLSSESLPICMTRKPRWPHVWLRVESGGILDDRRPDSRLPHSVRRAPSQLDDRGCWTVRHGEADLAPQRHGPSGAIADRG